MQVASLTYCYMLVLVAEGPDVGDSKMRSSFWTDVKIILCDFLIFQTVVFLSETNEKILKQILNLLGRKLQNGLRIYKIFPISYFSFSFLNLWGTWQMLCDTKLRLCIYKSGQWPTTINIPANMATLDLLIVFPAHPPINSTCGITEFLHPPK